MSYVGEINFHDIYFLIKFFFFYNLNKKSVSLILCLIYRLLGYFNRIYFVRKKIPSDDYVVALLVSAMTLIKRIGPNRFFLSISVPILW